MRLKMEVLSGPMDGHLFQFNHNADIGRDGTVLAIKHDRFISRRHARIDIQNTRVFLEDLKSTNGTFIDDERLSGRIELNNGKVFRVGHTWLELSWEA